MAALLCVKLLCCSIKNTQREKCWNYQSGNVRGHHHVSEHYGNVRVRGRGHDDERCQRENGHGQHQYVSDHGQHCRESGRGGCHRAEMQRYR